MEMTEISARTKEMDTDTTVSIIIAREPLRRDEKSADLTAEKLFILLIQVALNISLAAFQINDDTMINHSVRFVNCNSI